MVVPDAEAAANKVVELFLQVRPMRIGLSGGSSPKRAYELLAKASYDWDDCDLFVVDERWVPKGDDQSNSKMIQDTLASRVTARFHTIETAVDIEESVAEYEAELASRSPLDLVLLGLGEDGHTASLFPGGPELNVASRVTAAYGAGLRRVTMTLRTLNEARTAIFLVTGPEKKKALEELLSGGDTPAARVRPTERLVVVADRAASSESVV